MRVKRSGTGRAISAVAGVLIMAAGCTPGTGGTGGTTTLGPPKTASCTWAGQSVSVTWREQTSAFGPIAKIDSLSETTNAAGAWRMVWTTPPGELGPAGDGDSGPGWMEANGNAAQLNAATPATYLSPRVTPPDGLCTVYLYPFVQGSGPRRAIVGDSLAASLRDKDYNATWLQGYVQGNLATDGYSAQVEAQGARRLTASPVETGAGSATMIDEIRGLRQLNVGGIVVELGANDAIGVALGQESLSAMLAKIDSATTELVGYGVCVVLVTAPQQVTNIGLINGNTYLDAVTQINNRYRLYANANPNDTLKVIDWATWSAGHQYGQPNPWYGSDNLHLTLAGKLQLTATLKNGAEMC